MHRTVCRFGICRSRRHSRRGRTESGASLRNYLSRNRAKSRRTQAKPLDILGREATELLSRSNTCQTSAHCQWRGLSDLAHTPFVVQRLVAVSPSDSVIVLLHACEQFRPTMRVGVVTLNTKPIHSLPREFCGRTFTRRRRRCRRAPEGWAIAARKKVIQKADHSIGSAVMLAEYC